VATRVHCCARAAARCPQPSSLTAPARGKSQLKSRHVSPARVLYRLPSEEKALCPPELHEVGRYSWRIRLVWGRGQGCFRGGEALAAMRRPCRPSSDDNHSWIVHAALSCVADSPILILSVSAYRAVPQRRLAVGCELQCDPTHVPAPQKLRRLGHWGAGGGRNGELHPSGRHR
jgi:hypothetical protein